MAQPGDIAFFENRFGRIVHSGIILPDNQLLHSLGQVKIDVMDHYGVFDINKNQMHFNGTELKRCVSFNTKG